MTLRMERTEGHPETASREHLQSLFEAHDQRLFRLALRLAASRDDALDLVQETFARAARRAPALPPQDAAEAWLVRILVNLARDTWRRQAVRRVAAHLRPRRDQAGSGGPVETRVAVREALTRLAPRRRVIVVLSEFEGRTSSEIGEVLRLSDATVRWHLAAARRQLRRLLRPHMGGSDAATE